MSNNLPDFVSVYNRFRNEGQFSNGDRAEIRKATVPSDLGILPSFYKLLGNRLNEGEKQWQRVVFFLVKGLTHKEKGPSLGTALKTSDKKVREQRIFQVIRSESPNDLIQLRRLVIHTEPSLDFHKFAKQVWYWSEFSKKQLLKDFLMTENKDQNNQKPNQKGENNE